MKHFLLAAALVVVPVAAKAEMTPIAQMPAGVYELDKTHASLTWKVSHLGLSDYTARFNTFDASLTLDPANITQSSVNVTISPLSIETDYPNADEKDFDKKLTEGEDWFNVGAFPEITFASTAIEQTGENTGKVTGDLSLLGVTKPVTLDVVFNGAYESKPFANVPAVGFSATGTIKRSDWGFDTYVPTIGDEVELLIEVEFEKPVAPGDTVNE
ncbi:MAG: YceI family protein [Pseudomonadota bacterium]